MNLKKFLGYAAGFTILGAVVVACNGVGSTRSNPNTAYGQLVSGGTAESNPALAGYLSRLPTILQSANPVSMAALNILFAPVAVNSYLNPAAGQQATLKTQNESYINNTPAIFGIVAPVKVETGPEPTGYVNNQAAAAKVSAAKYDYITYTTPGAPYMFTGNSTSTEVVSGLVVLPLASTGAPLDESQIKGVVLYYHPTILSKGGIPSGYGNSHESTISLDDQATFYSQFELASIYASDGYIVIAPDYIGQGIDSAVVHPYVLLPEPNALSGIYMLKALDTYLQESYNINLANTESKSLFISSYSEGGGYALKAANLIGGSYANIIESTGLILKRTVGVSGAYDLTNQELPFAFDNVNNPPNAYDKESNPWNASPGCEPGNSVCDSLIQNSPAYAAKYRAWAQYDMASAKPPLGTYMVNTLVVYDYLSPVAYDLVLVPPYASQSTCLDPASLTSTFSDTDCATANLLASGMDASYNVMNLFNTPGLNQSNIAAQVFNAAAANKYFVGDYPNTIALIKGLAGGDATNSVSSFVQSSLLTDPSIASLIHNADTYYLTTNTPVSLLSVKYDSTVTNLNWMSACGMLGANGNIHDNSPGKVTCTQIDNSQLFSNVSFFGAPSQSEPVYMNHQAIEAITQIAAHNQMVTNPSGN
jgi:hypothetical protein